jgi:hypothetical protein
MKVKTLGWLVVAGALATSFISCSQPKVECTAAHAGAFYGFAAKYTPVGTPPACATPDFIQAGDTIGFETYHPSKDDGDGPQADYSSTIVAIQADTLGATAKDKRKAGAGDPLDPLTPGVDKKAVTYKGGHNAFAFGNFDSTEPDDADFCKLSTVTPAKQEYAEIPAAPPDQPDPIPATTYGYAWKNLEVYVTATSQGTQFSGDLTYSQDTCSVDYHVVGVWPGVGCLLDFDDMGNPIFQDSLCCPDADPNDDNRSVGSGINPDFPVVCDHTLGMCVLEMKDGDKLPVLKPDWSKDNAAHPECKPRPAKAASTP